MFKLIGTNRVCWKPHQGYLVCCPADEAKYTHYEPQPIQLGAALRVRPETSGRIAEFSEHEAD